MEARLLKEFKTCKKMDNFTIRLVDDALTKWYVSFNPQNPRYTKKQKFMISFPSSYPFEKPKVIFDTNTFHPNINSKGEPCLELLNNWKITSSCVEILSHIISMFDQPDLDNPSNALATNLWPNIKEFLKKS